VDPCACAMGAVLHVPWGRGGLRMDVHAWQGVAQGVARGAKWVRQGGDTAPPQFTHSALQLRHLTSATGVVAPWLYRLHS
jgi:hypothetical protein